ncbi:MAG: hypothetical protein F4Z60_04190 [Chloroflexi bacterium]|nr:hypothetical protein [Chloroflexota bacterium]
MAGLGMRWGSLDITAASDESTIGGRGDVRLIGSVPGDSVIFKSGEMTDAFLFGYRGDLPTPFRLEVGGAEFVSAHALHPDGHEVPLGRYWAWDERPFSWAEGDEVKVRISAADPLLIDTEEIWTSTLTVGMFGDADSGYLGYQDREDGSTSVGSLAPRTVTVGDTAYEFLILAWYRGNRSNSDGTSHTKALDFYAFDRAMPDDWVLTVDGKSFRVGDAYRGFLGNNTGRPVYKVYWTDPGFSWSVGETHRVSLAAPVG